MKMDGKSGGGKKRRGAARHDALCGQRCWACDGKLVIIRDHLSFALPTERGQHPFWLDGWISTRGSRLKLGDAREYGVMLRTAQ